jgi:thiol:disulfide interchange protein DsbC
MLGQQFGVQGTPSIVLPDGEMGEGYVPARQLIQAVGRSSS